MPTSKRPRDGNQFTKLAVDMTTRQVPNDKSESRNPPEPVGRANSVKAWAASPTPKRRSGGGMASSYCAMGHR